MVHKLEEYLYEIFETILPGFLAIVIFSSTLLFTMDACPIQALSGMLTIKHQAVSLLVPLGDSVTSLFKNNYGRTVLLILFILLCYVVGVLMSQFARQLVTWKWIGIKSEYFYGENRKIRVEVRERLLSEYSIIPEGFDQAVGLFTSAGLSCLIARIVASCCGLMLRTCLFVPYSPSLQ